MPDSSNTRAHPSMRDVPFPGNYPILTMQLNVTRYHAAGNIRWVLIVREPSDQLEVNRIVGEIQPDTASTDAKIVTDVLDALTLMLYMQTGASRAEGATHPA